MRPPRRWPGWTATGAGLGRQFAHDSGHLVIHCGHPTAHNPWHIIDPAGYWLGKRMGEVTRKGRPVGLVFRLVVDAMAHVEQLTGLLPPTAQDRAGWTLPFPE